MKTEELCQWFLREFRDIPDTQLHVFLESIAYQSDDVAELGLNVYNGFVEEYQGSRVPPVIDIDWESVGKTIIDNTRIVFVE